MLKSQVIIFLSPELCVMAVETFIKLSQALLTLLYQRPLPCFLDTELYTCLWIFSPGAALRAGMMCSSFQDFLLLQRTKVCCPVLILGGSQLSVAPVPGIKFPLLTSVGTPAHVRAQTHTHTHTHNLKTRNEAEVDIKTLGHIWQFG